MFVLRGVDRVVGMSHVRGVPHDTQHKDLGHVYRDCFPVNLAHTKLYIDHKDCVSGGPPMTREHKHSSWGNPNRVVCSEGRIENNHPFM